MPARTVSYCVRAALVAALLVSANAANAQPNLPKNLVASFAHWYAASQVRNGTPRADAWIHGSPGSVRLLNAYRAQTLADVNKLLTGRAQGKVENWLLASPSNGNGQKAEATTSDKFAQVRGFKVDIANAGGKEVDTAWESVSGGEMIIELTETTIGSDKFADLDFRGPLARIGTELAKPGCNDGCIPCDLDGDEVILNLLSKDGRPMAGFEYNALAAVYAGNEMLLLWVDECTLRTTHFQITPLTPNGQPEPPAPVLLFPFPAQGKPGDRIAIAATRGGGEPYFNVLTTRRIAEFSTSNIPLIGSISLGFTIVPPAAPPGRTELTIDYNGIRSNPFPFTVR